MPFFIELHAVSLVEQLHTFSLEAVTDVTLDGNEVSFDIVATNTTEFAEIHFKSCKFRSQVLKLVFSIVRRKTGLTEY